VKLAAGGLATFLLVVAAILVVAVAVKLLLF
jgi:hypothetical protein